MIFVAYAAPFATFREFGAGHLRTTARFATHSALYGFLLNLAGVEMRGSLGSRATPVADDLPSFLLASAARRVPTVTSMYQQLHTVPVGATSRERKPLTKGNKHHIVPGRRQILRDLSGLCAIRADVDFEKKLEAGLESTSVYGLPFLGDNNFFLSQLEVVRPAQNEVRWLVPGAFGKPPGRLTIWADRASTLETRSLDFAYRTGPANQPPEEAWVRVGPVAS